MGNIIDDTKVVYQGRPGTSISTLWTAPPQNSGEEIKEIIICNTTTQAADISLYRVASGGTAGPDNQILYASIPGKSTPTILALSTDLAPGEFIAGSQVSAGAICVTITNYQK